MAAEDTECAVEFAKIAMSNQALDHDEVINVRWAVEDPNQGVRKRLQAEGELRVWDAMARAGRR